MWLTLHFPDLCRYTSILTHYPPLPPAYPTSPYKYAPVRGSSCFGGSCYHVMSHHICTLSNVYRAIRPLSNCYAISCRVILRVKGCDHKKQCVLKKRCTFYPYPYYLWSHYIYTGRTKHKRISNHWNTWERNRNGTYLFEFVFVCFQYVSSLFIQLMKITIAILCCNCFSKSMESRTTLNTRKIKFTTWCTCKT